jgi:DNA replication licensing factor MCM7
MWLILDRPGLEADLALAQHVLSVHRHGVAPKVASARPPLPPELLRAYIAAAKAHSPTVPAALGDYVAAVYAELRAEEAAAEVPHSYTTARTLLSILRMGQALARLRFADVVEQSDVDEALRLLKMSKSSLLDDAGGERAADPVSQVFARIRQHAERTRRAAYTWAELVDLLGTQFRPEQIRQCLLDYASINVWQLEGGDADAPGIRLEVA